MTHAALQWYLEANVLMAAAWGMAALLGRTQLPSLSQRDAVLLARMLLVLALAAPAAAALMPRHALFADVTTLWQPVPRVDADLLAAARLGATDSPAHSIAAPPSPPLTQHPLATLALAVAALASLAALIRLAQSLRDRRRLGALLTRGFVWRRRGRLTVTISSDTPIPFSYRSWRTAHVVLPAELVATPAALRIALRHEGVHHRHGDTSWLRALELLRLVFPLNPFASLWTRTLSELQEFACDEAVVGRDRVAPQAYGRCLLQVGEAACSARAHVFRHRGAASMAATRRDPNQARMLLERRLSMLASYRQSAPRRLAAVLATGLAALTCTLAYAAKGERLKAPLTLDQGRALVDAMPPVAGFPIVINEAVLDRLNFILTKPGRVDFVRQSLKRMQEHRPMIEQHLGRYGLPDELLAVPLIESGYQNMTQRAERLPNGVIPGAGLWMFIRQTARVYGLQVDSKVDERLNPALQTDAAMRYLGANYLRYKDWMLALAAYNMGEGAVDKALQEARHRDAWRLVTDGHINDYIVHVMAGVILLKNPRLLE